MATNTIKKKFKKGEEVALDTVDFKNNFNGSYNENVTFLDNVEIEIKIKTSCTYQ